MKDDKITGKWIVLSPCVNQDTGKFHKKGDILTVLSATEFGRLVAFKYIEDANKTEKKQNDKARKKNNIKRQRSL